MGVIAPDYYASAYVLILLNASKCDIGYGWNVRIYIALEYLKIWNLNTE